MGNNPHRGRKSAKKGANMATTTTRYIRLTNKKGERSRRTAGHQALLEGKGYECRENGENLEVQATEVREGTIDLSTPEKAREALNDAVQNQAVFSYQTTFRFEDGKELSGVMALSRLGNASALVTKGEPKPKEKKVSPLDAIFDIL
jgi:hypothetical protein